MKKKKIEKLSTLKSKGRTKQYKKYLLKKRYAEDEDYVKNLPAEERERLTAKYTQMFKMRFAKSEEEGKKEEEMKVPSNLGNIIKEVDENQLSELDVNEIPDSEVSSISD